MKNLEQGYDYLVYLNTDISHILNEAKEIKVIYGYLRGEDSWSIDLCGFIVHKNIIIAAKLIKDLSPDYPCFNLITMKRQYAK